MYAFCACELYHTFMLYSQVPGFGKDESGNVSRSLKVLKFPVVDSGECFRKTNIRPQLGQFCGGFTNGTVLDINLRIGSVV